VIEKNAIAIEGTNTVLGPAGLLVKLTVEFEDGTTFELVSDKTWISTVGKAGHPPSTSPCYRED
jgi:hypothetical protein